MYNVYLFQPQFAAEFRNETNYWIPYSVGCLWSYAQQFDFVKEHFELKDLIFKRQDPDDVLNSMSDPHICGFSCYVWNQKYCLLLAEQIKQRWPNCIIVFGGPQASAKLLDLNYVDSVILAEGEENFVQLLQCMINNTPVSPLFLKQRLTNLDIPSPYTAGIFDKIIADNPTALWAMVLETNRGCPYACTFCDWGSTTYSKVKRFDLDKIAEELEWAVNNRITYLFCADANFGMFKERDLEIAKLIRSVGDRGCLETVNIQYAKNSTEVVFNIAKILGDLNKGVTVSVQSMNEPTLTAIKRKNLDINNIRHLMKLSQEHNVRTYTEAILGLPEETLDTWKTTLTDILEMGQHESIDIWFCQLLENSELNSLESKIKYGIKSIVATDFSPFSNKDDYKGILEEITLIKETNSMSTADLVEGYIYGWVITNFHISGYTQYYAKYCRHILNIPYRVFYDKLLIALEKDQLFGDHIKGIKKDVLAYLTTGQLLNNMKPLYLDSTKVPKLRDNQIEKDSSITIYENKEYVFDLGDKLVSSFTTNDISDIKQFQHYFIYDQSVNLPKSVSLPWNMLTWETVNTNYTVMTKINKLLPFDFYSSRRKGRLKNIII
jgi:radical SAM superfamily enzyme YgiQ (UPF0313 family)